MAKPQFGFSLDLGRTGKIRLFEGEPDHLVPAASEAFVESDFFWIAGRMLAPSAGLSRAIIRALLNGDP
ncbi:hypothetical protein CHARACLAT_033423 [Characodon lateralis]|uniref:Uncharacterized protein n=1 Tax=Characodon lateralis TaxID=208331 RepID=A0ABU7F033_9TELE|nr:hypothetical protein [Characodon lateralis]